MLLVIDVGNTNIVLGLMTGDKLAHDWRLQTVHGRTGDEHLILLMQLFRTAGVNAADVSDAVISSVVPPLTGIMAEACRKILSRDPLIVGPGTRTGVPILYEHPREVGADRIVNSVAAYERFGTAGVVVDFGTATTFDAISAKGEYLGGAIAPGISISSEALFAKASKLPRVQMMRTASVIGRTTETSMQAGLFYGYVGLVDGIVVRMLAELGKPAFVIATGGLAGLFLGESETIGEVDEYLTLHGLRTIYLRNRS